MKRAIFQYKTPHQYAQLIFLRYACAIVCDPYLRTVGRVCVFFLRIHNKLVTMCAAPCLQHLKLHKISLRCSNTQPRPPHKLATITHSTKYLACGQRSSARRIVSVYLCNQLLQLPFSLSSMHSSLTRRGHACASEPIFVMPLSHIR